MSVSDMSVGGVDMGVGDVVRSVGDGRGGGTMVESIGSGISKVGMGRTLL